MGRNEQIPPDPSLSPEQERSQFFEKYPRIQRLNEAIGYTHGGVNGEAKDSVLVHLAPMFEFGIKEKIRLVEEGLKLLAQKIESEPEFAHVEWIKAISWIVAEQPELLGRFGFLVRHNLSPEQKKEWYPDERHEQVGVATMWRKFFLERYGS